MTMNAKRTDRPLPRPLPDVDEADQRPITRDEANWGGPTREWCEGVDARLDYALKQQTSNGAAIAQNNDAIAENTRITTAGISELKRALDEHKLQAAPSIAAIEMMQSGVRYIGAVGDWLKKWVPRVIKFALFVGGGWIFMRHMVAGEGIESALSAFWRFVSGAR